MTTQKTPRKTQPLQLPNIPLPGGADSGTKWLIGAVLAAGKDDCQCDACKMLKKFGAELSAAMLQEGDGGGT